MTPSEGTTSTSQSLERGLAILAIVQFRAARRSGPASSRGVSALSRSTTHRYVTTLSRLDYLLQDPESRSIGSARRSSTSASRRSIRWTCARSPLRICASSVTRPSTRSTSRSSTASTSSPSIGAEPPSRASGRSISTCVWVPGCRPTAPRWARRCSRSLPSGRREEIIGQIDFAARPNTLADPDAFRAELARIRVSGVRSTTRSSPTASARSQRRFTRTRARCLLRAISPCTGRW